MTIKLCSIESLTPYQGKVALIEEMQVALFNIPQRGVFAIQNWDPIGRAHVLSRGIVGELNGELCVASPLYKQHFSLQTGQCLEQPEHGVRVWRVELREQDVWLAHL
ncbi:nitrite reductase small subunit NirD [Vibrio sp.]|uniref:nitrite reductase small subunit NirD n=1 Tax=Vibrio sp. TaxID=678 RepID=UPI003D10A32A